MVLRYYGQDDDTGDLVEWVNAVPVMHAKDDPGSDGLVTNAEEGSVGRVRLRVEDPDGTFSVRGHRKVVAIEDEATSDAQEGITGIYFTNTREMGEWSSFDGTGRVIDVELDDLNAVLERRVMEGSDANREKINENDVERVQWLFGTAEMAPVESDAFLFTDDPVDLDGADLRGQRVRDILDDCAQHSGKNWFVLLDPDDPTVFALWYGHGDRTDHSSIAKISNVAADIDPEHETDPVYAPAAIETRVKSDPARVFSGARVNADGLSVYVRLAATAVMFAERDTIIPAENVKTRAQARARGMRELRDLRTEEHTIRTAIVVKAEHVNRVSWGHRIAVKLTWAGVFGHVDYTEYVWTRVMNRTARQVGQSTYELALELASDVSGPGGTGSGVGDGGGGADVFATLNRPGTVGETGQGSVLMWGSNGDTPKPGWPTEPTQGLLSIITDPDPPSAPWPYSGIQVDGDGTLDRIEFMAFTAGVLIDDVSYTVTWAILVNGVAAADETQVVLSPTLDFWGGEQLVIATNVAVSNGDVIEGRVTSNPPMPYFRVPSGTGGQDERLRIIGGTLA